MTMDNSIKLRLEFIYNIIKNHLKEHKNGWCHIMLKDVGYINDIKLIDDGLIIYWWLFEYNNNGDICGVRDKGEIRFRALHSSNIDNFINSLSYGNDDLYILFYNMFITNLDNETLNGYIGYIVNRLNKLLDNNKIFIHNEFIHEINYRDNCVTYKYFLYEYEEECICIINNMAELIRLLNSIEVYSLNNSYRDNMINNIKLELELE